MLPSVPFYDYEMFISENGKEIHSDVSIQYGIKFPRTIL